MKSPQEKVQEVIYFGEHMSKPFYDSGPTTNLYKEACGTTSNALKVLFKLNLTEDQWKLVGY